MALIDLWKAQPDELREKQVHQLIAIAGEGRLKDGNSASEEFRKFLGVIQMAMLRVYAQQCLDSSFTDSGLALQDIVNEVGRRAGFEVRDGRYRGSAGHVGFDGLWRAPEGHEIVVEVKTTDAYRIDLNTLATYRRTLVKQGAIAEDRSSILIVVGRQDTGDLEAQIRGSRYAWDIRLISVEYLLKLLKLREGVEEPDTARRIRMVLVPEEFTRLDGIIDLVFSTTEDILQEDLAEGTEEMEEDDERKHEGKKFTPVSFHEACVERIEAQLDRSFLRRSRASFSTPDGQVTLVCAVSREYERSGYEGYWYAFHPHQAEFLEEGDESFVAFGCGSPEQVILIPYETFKPWLSEMHQTNDDDGRSYRHVRIDKIDGRFTLRRRKDARTVELTEYLVKSTNGNGV